MRHLRNKKNKVDEYIKMLLVSGLLSSIITIMSSFNSSDLTDNSLFVSTLSSLDNGEQRGFQLGSASLAPRGSQQKRQRGDGFDAFSERSNSQSSLEGGASSVELAEMRLYFAQQLKAMQTRMESRIDVQDRQIADLAAKNAALEDELKQLKYEMGKGAKNGTSGARINDLQVRILQSILL